MRVSLSIIIDVGGSGGARLDFRFWPAGPLFRSCDSAQVRFRLADHRITRSALARRFGGMITPICFAAFRLITNSNFVGCSTGSSAGFVPLKSCRHRWRCGGIAIMRAFETFGALTLLGGLQIDDPARNWYGRSTSNARIEPI